MKRMLLLSLIMDNSKPPFIIIKIISTDFGGLTPNLITVMRISNRLLQIMINRYKNRNSSNSLERGEVGMMDPTLF